MFQLQIGKFNPFKVTFKGCPSADITSQAICRSCASSIRHNPPDKVSVLTSDESIILNKWEYFNVVKIYLQ